MGGHDGEETKKSSFFDLKFHNIALGLFQTIDDRVTNFREKVVVPNQNKSGEKWFHRRFNRVPTIENCDVDDFLCQYEADQQYVRDKQVDSNIVRILRQRKTECLFWEGPDGEYKCRDLIAEYEDAATNWFIKYGELRTYKNALEAYMKQKHRLIWERRHPDKKMR